MLLLLAGRRVVSTFCKLLAWVDMSGTVNDVLDAAVCGRCSGGPDDISGTLRAFVAPEDHCCWLGAVLGGLMSDPAFDEVSRSSNACGMASSFPVFDADEGRSIVGSTISC